MVLPENTFNVNVVTGHRETWENPIIGTADTVRGKKMLIAGRLGT